MPIYEYECPKCKRIEEKQFPITAFPQTIKCPVPECKGDMVKIVSGCTFRLRGMGWTKGHGYI